MGKFKTEMDKVHDFNVEHPIGEDFSTGSGSIVKTVSPAGLNCKGYATVPVVKTCGGIEDVKLNNLDWN